MAEDTRANQASKADEAAAAAATVNAGAGANGAGAGDAPRVDTSRDESDAKVGASVNLVLADGRPHPAKITKVNRQDGTVDLEFDLRGEKGVAITNSPFDVTAKKPDSWHFAAKE